MAIYINRQAPQSGIAGLLASRGRQGDTELVHMTKPEVQRLMQTGLLSLNPKTGLPEYFLGDLWKGAKGFVKNIFKPKNLIPMIASIALPAIAGPAFGAMTGLGQLATSSILSGLGTAGGSLFTGSNLEDAARSGVFSGAMKFGMGKLSQALGPDLPTGHGMSAKEFAEQRPQPLTKGAKKFWDLEGDGLEFSMDDMSDHQQWLQSQGSILKELNRLKDDRAPVIGGYPTKTIDNPFDRQPFHPHHSDPDLNFKPFDAELRSELIPIEVPDQYSLHPIDRVPLRELSPAEYKQYLQYSLDQADKAGQFNLTGEFSQSEKEDLARGAAFKFKRDLPTNKLEFTKAMTRLQDPYSDTRGIVSEEGLGSLTSEDFWKSLPLSEMASAGFAGLEGAMSSEAMALQDKQEQDLLEQLMSQSRPRSKSYIPGSYIRTRTKKTRPKTEKEILEQYLRGGKDSSYYGPTTYRIAEEGGLVGLNTGGKPDFEGSVPGVEHGMADNVIMDIKDKGGLLAVSPKEYVVPADVMSGLGNGNPDAGANHMDKFIKDFRKKKYGRAIQPPEMDGSKALQSLMSRKES